MTSFWDAPEKFERMGVDYDLDACLQYNPQPFTIHDIEKVLAVWEGENDGDDWRWVIQLKSHLQVEGQTGKYVYLQGGCDYTGWDCQSWATCSVFSSKTRAARSVNLSSWGDDIQHLVTISLLEQLKSEKAQTWKERKRKELGLDDLDLPKIE